MTTKINHRKPRRTPGNNRKAIKVATPANELTPEIYAMMEQFKKNPPKTAAQLISHAEQLAQSARESMYRQDSARYSERDLFNMRYSACKMLEKHALYLNNGVSTDAFLVTGLTVFQGAFCLNGIWLFHRNRIGNVSLCPDFLQYWPGEINCNIERMDKNDGVNRKIGEVFPGNKFMNFTIDAGSPKSLIDEIRKATSDISTQLDKYFPKEIKE